MNNIFYIHSNILTICCYQTVKECIERKEKVIIITNRGYAWPFFEGKVEVYDFAKIFQGEDKDRVALHSIKAIRDYVRYRKYLAHLNGVVNRIVNKEDFYFYLPSMALVMTSIFAHNKYCKGYYYVDEGYLAYTPADKLQRYVPRGKRNIIKSWLRIEDHYHLETTSKFKGTISITQEAFEWNTNKDRIVNTVNDYISEVKQDIPVYDDVIITGYLKQDFNIIKESIDFAIREILQKKPNSKIGIKIHPQAITYNKEKTNKLQQYLEENYPGFVSLIPINVSIEVMSLVCHPTLYSLLGLSSIVLYAVLFKSSQAKLIDYKDGLVSVVEINSVKDYDENIKIK